MIKNRFFSYSDLFFRAALFLLLLITYWPVLTECYAFRDDYVYMFSYTHHRSHIIRALSAMGRPLYDLATTLAFSRLNHTCDLGVLRQLCWTSLVFFAWLVYGFSRKCGCSKIQSFVLSLGICTVPGISLFVFWAITFPFILSLITPILAFYCLFFAKFLTKKLRFFSAVFLIILSFLMYQIGTMVFWLAFTIWLFSPQSQDRRASSYFILAISVFTTAVLIYYSGYKLMPPIITDPEVIAFVDRGGFIHDFSGKLHQVILLIARAASLGAIKPVLGIIVLVLTLIIRLAVYQNAKQTVIRAIVILWIIIMSLFPVLPVHELQINLRLISVTSAIFWVFSVFGFSLFLKPISIQACRIILIVITLGHAVAIYRTMQFSITLFQTEKRVAETDILQHPLDSEDNKVYFVQVTEDNWLLGEPRTVEYGTPSLQYSIGETRTQYRRIYYELTGRPSMHMFQVCPPQDGIGCDLDLLNGDVSKIRNLRDMTLKYLQLDWPLQSKYKILQQEIFLKEAGK